VLGIDTEVETVRSRKPFRGAQFQARDCGGAHGPRRVVALRIIPESLKSIYTYRFRKRAALSRIHKSSLDKGIKYEFRTNVEAIV